MTRVRRIAFLGGIVVRLALTHPVAAATFANPVDPDGHDPWVIRWQELYYYCWSEGGAIRVGRAERLQDIARGPAAVVWTPPPGQPYSREIWAPELHRVDGSWYIYFAADDGANANHRMWVLRAATDDPQGGYTFLGQITDPTNKWAIDGTVLATDDGELFFIWSGWEGYVDIQQNLYISPMSDPWTISGTRVLISEPEHAWERNGGPPFVNEGPQVLEHDGRIFVVYSASGSWTDDYCLGQLTLTGDDVLDPDSWVKAPAPVFSRTPHVFGPGHASFVRSPDYAERWIVYHAAKYPGAGWDRDVRLQSFDWSPEGIPLFGAPVATGIHVTEPSGSPFGITYEAEDAIVNHAQILNHSSASGEGKVGYIDYGDSYVEFTVDAAHAGVYRLHVRYGAGLGAASHEVSVNGAYAATVQYPQADWDDWRFQTDTVVYLEAGPNAIRFSKAGGYAELDFIGVHPGPEGDINNDGLPDDWERGYFGHLHEDGAGPDEDFDDDGQSNCSEYVADTDPTDAGRFLHMTGLAILGGSVEVRWEGGTAATQLLERCTRLVPSAEPWSVVLTNLPPTATSGTWSEPVTGESLSVYRIRAVR